MQTLLIKRVLPLLGEARTVVAGFGIVVAAYLCYGFATQGWMIYATIVVAALSGIAGPALQSYITRHVPADEQGSVQGALSSLTSVASVIGLPVGAWSFGWAISPGHAPWIEGIAFFEGAVLVALALWLAVRSFRRDAVPAKTPPARADFSP